MHDYYWDVYNRTLECATSFQFAYCEPKLFIGLNKSAVITMIKALHQTAEVKTNFVCIHLSHVQCVTI